MERKFHYKLINRKGQMSEIFLFYELTITSGYCRVAKNLGPALKGVIQVKFYFHEILTKIQKKKD